MNFYILAKTSCYVSLWHLWLFNHELHKHLSRGIMFLWESLLAGLDRGGVQEKPSGQSSSSVGIAGEWEGHHQAMSTWAWVLNSLWSQSKPSKCYLLWKHWISLCLCLIHDLFAFQSGSFANQRREKMSFRITNQSLYYTTYFYPYNICHHENFLWYVYNKSVKQNCHI